MRQNLRGELTVPAALVRRDSANAPIPEEVKLIRGILAQLRVGFWHVIDF